MSFSSIDNKLAFRVFTHCHLALYLCKISRFSLKSDRIVLVKVAVEIARFTGFFNRGISPFVRTFDF
jgi:hypothetical protein